MAKADLAMVLTWRNHPVVRRHMYTQKEISFEEHSNWFQAASGDPQRCLLILEVDSVPRGYVNFRRAGKGEAVWGFYLAPDALKGTGRLLGKSATDYAFGVLRLERIWGEVLSDNHASQAFHQHQGFVLESIMKNMAGGEQNRIDVHRYLLTREVWQSRKGVRE